MQVQDTGIGIVKEQIPYLFERFRQAEGSANRSYEGSGLGLALVKELVEMHTVVQVTVESVYGQGLPFLVCGLVTGTMSFTRSSKYSERPLEMNTSRASVQLADLELVESTTDNIEDITINFSPNIDTQDSALKTEHSILVVDDNPDLRTYVSEIFRRNGYHVRTARNGYEGHSLAKEIIPSLIVTDLMMPLVSGT